MTPNLQLFMNRARLRLRKFDEEFDVRAAVLLSLFMPSAARVCLRHGDGRGGGVPTQPVCERHGIGFQSSGLFPCWT